MTTLATWLADPSFRARLVDALADAIVAHTLRTSPSPSRSGASPGVRPAPHAEHGPTNIAHSTGG